VRLGVVVQRYGAEINGGAELHARYVAERLSRHADVEVFTTCARDYVTWENALPPGASAINGVPVHRFPVTHPRDVRQFGTMSDLVFTREHSIRDELAWLDSEGPTSPALVKAVASARDRFDWFLFFSYRYYHAYHGVRALPDRAVLVPTAERDAAVGLSIFGPIFRGVRALMFNSFEERAMLQHAAGGVRLPGPVVGIGSDVPERTHPDRFRRKYGITGPFALYVGRIDENKGCAELFEFFRRYVRSAPGPLQLVLIGNSILPIPDHPRIRHLGFLDDADKFDAIAAAEVLVMPSYFESLSMVALEAWALGTPVLANGRCDVLKGQCLRSNAGLFYESYPEFAETLHAIATGPMLSEALGRNGRDYYRRHYAWPVIERKYLETFDRLARERRDGSPGIEPLPGFFARRRRTAPPAADVLARIPAGAVTP
jgi:glycosyltransferase involved in cell wall biosynthesis